MVATPCHTPSISNSLHQLGIKNKREESLSPIRLKSPSTGSDKRSFRVKER